MNLCGYEGCDSLVFGQHLLCDAHRDAIMALGEQSPTDGDLEVERLTAALNATRGEITAMRSRWLRIRVLSRELLHLLEEMP